MTGVHGDVSNLGDRDRLFAQIKREKGRLDIVFANAGIAFANAGIAKYGRLGEITEERSFLLQASERCRSHRGATITAALLA